MVLLLHWLTGLAHRNLKYIASSKLYEDNSYSHHQHPTHRIRYMHTQFLMLSQNILKTKKQIRFEYHESLFQMHHQQIVLLMSHPTMIRVIENMLIWYHLLLYMLQYDMVSCIRLYWRDTLVHHSNSTKKSWF